MRILIADHHEFVRDAIRSILGRLDPEPAILECGTLDEAIEIASADAELDLILLNWGMPGMNGFAGMDYFLTHHPEAKIVLLPSCNRCHPEQTVEALKRGAAGVIPKTLGSESLLHAFELVLAGVRFVPEDILLGDQEGFEGMVSDRAKDNNVQPLHSLTSREREVLDQLMDGLSNKEIARKLDIAEVSVKRHMSGVLRKLRAANRAQAVRFAFDFGWEEQDHIA